MSSIMLVFILSLTVLGVHAQSAEYEAPRREFEDKYEILKAETKHEITKVQILL